MIAALLAALAALPGAMDVQRIPVDLARATCFVAAVDPQGPAELFVLEGNVLRLHAGTPGAAPREVTLPEGAGALDVADVTGDGFADLVVVAGDRVLRYGLGGVADGPPEVIVERANQFSAPAHTPRLHVLVAQWGGRPCVVLPTDDALELHAPGGGLVEAFPMGADAPHAALYGQPFRATPMSRPLLGPPDSLEFRVGSALAVKPQLPEALAPAAPGPDTPAYNPSRRARDAARLPVAQWPTLPLRAGAPEAVAAYAVIDGPPLETVARVRAAPPRADDPDAGFGPARRYPGAIVATNAPPPDFSGDGFADLLLWTAPSPGPTVANLSRAAMRGVWEARLAAHAYLPEKFRFDPRPFGRIRVEIPAAWFIAGGAQGPLRHVALRDFDGDGRTDLGMAVADDTYAVWFAGAEGFPARPDFLRRFDEPILGIAFEASLHGRGATTLGLRGARALHILRAAPRHATVPALPAAPPAPVAIGPVAPGGPADLGE